MNLKKKRKKKKVILFISLLLFLGYGVLSSIVTATSSQKESVNYYSSLEEVAIKWGEINKTEGNERFAHILSKNENGKRVYFIKRTYEGKPRNSYLGSFSSYYIYGISCLFTPTKMEATIHTHPFKNPIFIGSNTSNSDIWGLYIPGNRKGFVVFPNGEVAQYFKDGNIQILNPI